MKKIFAMIAMASCLLLTLAGTAEAETLTYTTQMSGGQEVGDAGDPDGRGTATITIDTVTNQVCYTIEVSGIDTPSAAHIHEGGFGSNGGVVVDLMYPANGSSHCVDGGEVGTNKVVTNPTLFYVNVHNSAFANGAVRGQLGAPSAVAVPAVAGTGGGEELAFTGPSELTAMFALMGTGMLATGALYGRAARRRSQG